MIDNLPLTICFPQTPPPQASAGIAAPKVVGQRFPAQDFWYFLSNISEIASPRFLTQISFATFLRFPADESDN